MHADRLAACQQRLADSPADAAVFAPGANLTYLTGFETEASERALFLFVTSDAVEFFVPELVEEQVAASTPIDQIRTWRDDETPHKPLSALCADLGLAGDDTRLLIDETMWARFTHLLRDVFPQATVGLATELMAALRIRKDDAELAALRRAAAAADTAMMRLRDRGDDLVGLTESAVATRIETELADAGGESLSFEPIVAAGPHGARPHHTHGDREIRAGEPVVLDFGCRIDGYPSDQTRTVVFGGEPSARFTQGHEIVRRAQRAAIERVEPGVTAGDVDEAARSVIEQAGYGEQFMHRTGHGVGLAVHEEPEISAGNNRRLEPGMVFSVEPGVYCSGEFGVRIEDLVVVTETGCERLNTTPRGWQCE